MRLKKIFAYDPVSEKAEEKNRYYEKVSFGYALSRKITYILAFLISVIFLIGNMNTLSFNSFYYLAKDFELAADYVKHGKETLSYTAGSSQSFAIYRGGLAVVSRESISVLSAGGKEELFEAHQYGNPIIDTSSKYILVYDSGGNKYSLYNSFSKVREEKSENKIYGAALADNGTYALITTSKDHTSVVKVINSKGKEYSYNFTELVCGIDITADGRKLAVSLVSGNGDDLENEMRIYEIGEETPQHTSKSINGLPIEFTFFKNGGVCAIYSDSIVILDKKLNVKEEYFSESHVTSYSVSDHRAVIAFEEAKGQRTKVVAIDNGGDIRYNGIVNEEILSVEVFDKYLFVQSPNGFERINLDSPKNSLKISYPATDIKMLILDKDTLLACSTSHARYINFS